MSEEIKEIISLLKSTSWCKEAEQIEDCITNLQQENENQKELIRKQSKRNSRQRLANTKQQDLILKLQQENERLKERVAYLERSNNRREDTIIGLRFEVAEQEDYKSRCEKAIDKTQYIIDYGFDYDGLNTVESLKSLIDMLVNYARETKNILQNGSEDNDKN